MYRCVYVCIYIYIYIHMTMYGYIYIYIHALYYTIVLYSFRAACRRGGGKVKDFLL